MTLAAETDSMVRRLTHFETVYRPGEASAVVDLFNLLGCKIETLGPEQNPFIIGYLDSLPPNDVDNFIGGSQAMPEQWAFDQALSKALGEGELAKAYADYRSLQARHPYWTTHVGMRFESVAGWEAAVARLEKVEELAPNLAGRVELKAVLRPGAEGSLSDITHQAFVWTDVLACGTLALGMLFELQYHNIEVAAERAAAAGR